jgi:hypothetical protein
MDGTIAYARSIAIDDENRTKFLPNHDLSLCVLLALRKTRGPLDTLFDGAASRKPNSGVISIQRRRPTSGSLPVGPVKFITDPDSEII